MTKGLGGSDSCAHNYMHRVYKSLLMLTYKLPTRFLNFTVPSSGNLFCSYHWSPPNGFRNRPKCTSPNLVKNYQLCKSKAKATWINIQAISYLRDLKVKLSSLLYHFLQTCWLNWLSWERLCKNWWLNRTVHIESNYMLEKIGCSLELHLLEFWCKKSCVFVIILTGSFLYIFDFSSIFLLMNTHHPIISLGIIL